ncbi:hypothetical protein GUJ93_ZPchr0014g46917 [Zizania palustris]|uniref:Uncharacterized protein n=1 Tax=Zizania palustris TaxID=103762 RepID=A0A8J5SWT4_ZIZPA|nr:hypothetical protein GUJ93_ZPchr0014g46917 [Zizania palustris]
MRSWGTATGGGGWGRGRARRPRRRRGGGWWQSAVTPATARWGMGPRRRGGSPTGGCRGGAGGMVAERGDPDDGDDAVGDGAEAARWGMGPRLSVHSSYCRQGQNRKKQVIMLLN